MTTQHFLTRFSCNRENVFYPDDGVTTRVVFLYQVILGIASYTEQNLAILSRLYSVEYFCYSVQVMRSRIFLLFRVGYTEQNISTIPSRLCRVEYFCYSGQVIPSRTFLLFRVGDTQQKISAIPGRLYTEQNICSLLF